MASYLLLQKKEKNYEFDYIQREQIKQFGKNNLCLLNNFMVKKFRR